MSDERPDLGPLPEWRLRSPGVLIVTGPHAIPISTAVRAGDRSIVLGLARRRETLARLLEDPRAAFALLGAGVAFTAYGRAAVVREQLDDAPSVAAIELRVERVQDHLADGRTEMLDPARWRWLSDEAREADERVVAEIVALAHG